MSSIYKEGTRAQRYSPLYLGARVPSMQIDNIGSSDGFLDPRGIGIAVVLHRLFAAAESQQGRNSCSGVSMEHDLVIIL